MSNSTELISFLNKSGFELLSTQVGLTLTFYKGYEQRSLETSRDELFEKSSRKIQCWLRKIICQYLFRHLLHNKHKFQNNAEALNLKEVKHDFQIINEHCNSFHSFVGYTILKHFVELKKKTITLVSKRVSLLDDANEKLQIRTEEGILALNDIIKRSAEVSILEHPTIVECKSRIDKYYKALEFVSYIDVNDNSKLSNLNSNQIESGIIYLQEFSDIVTNSAENLIFVKNYKIDIDHELHNSFLPFQESFLNSLIMFEKTTGSIVYKNIENSLKEPKLLDLFNSLDSTLFISKDMKLLYADCKIFIDLLFDLFPKNNAIGAIEYINNNCNTSSNQVLLKQLEQFRLWADIQLSAITLKIALSSGRVPKSANGDENEVEIETIQDLIDKLVEIKKPSDSILSVISAGLWTIKVRIFY
jgi:hypothetical protein